MVSFKDKIRTRLGAFIGLIALASIAFMYVALRCTILNFHQDTGIIGKLPVWIRILLSPYLFTGYLRVLAVPVDLGFDKKLIASSLADPRFVASWITVFVIAAIFYYLYKKGRREKLFYLSWFVIGIIPVLHVFVPLVAIANDHWTYIPSLGYFAFFLSISDDWLRKILPDKRASHAFALICAILTIFYATVTHTQNRYWKDDESLFTRMYAVNKYTGRTQFNLARVYEQKGQYGKAMEFYDMAIKSSEGRFAYMYNARGMLRIKTGDMAGAKKDFEAAAEIRR
jgi:tetratricopeptide (TPR) repeat protein